MPFGCWENLVIEMKLEVWNLDIFFIHGPKKLIKSMPSLTPIIVCLGGVDLDCETFDIIYIMHKVTVLRLKVST